MNRSEKQMAVWLAHPQEFGEPPRKVHQIHHEKTVWPLLDRRVDLAFHEYETQGGYRGIGMTGPITWSFLDIDLGVFSMAELKRLYAGWYISFRALNSPAYSAERNRQRSAFQGARLGREVKGYIEMLDYLSFGDLVYYAYKVRRDGAEAVVVTDTKTKAEYAVGHKYLRLPPLFYFLGSLFYDGEM